MKFALRIFLLVALLAVETYTLYGQQKFGRVQGSIKPLYPLNLIMQDLIESPDGGVVCLMTAQDTLYTIVLNEAFVFEKVPRGEATVRFMHINFEPVEKEIVITEETECLLSPEMKTRNIQEIVVEGEAPLIRVIGDTIRFNAAALKMMEGDVALDILRQVPGAEISDSGIKIFGQNVTRTYVNKRLVFGTNVLSALKYLPAEEVTSIDTYMEQEELNKIIHNTDQRVRVLNIRTKNPIVAAVAANALGSYGRDFGSAGKDRYHLGAVGNFFSEKLLLAGNVLWNNTNRMSNSPQEIMQTVLPDNAENKRIYANAGIEKVWFKDTKNPQGNFRLKLDYTFDRNRMLSENRTQYIYLPSEEYSSREADNNLMYGDFSTVHRATASFYVRQPGWSIGLENNLNFSDDETENTQIAMTMLNGDVRRNRLTSQADRSFLNSTHNAYARLSGKKLSANVSVNYQRNAGDGNGVRIDSLASGPLKKIVETEPFGVGHKVNAAAGMTLYAFDNVSFHFKYGYSYEYSVNRRMAVDWSAPEQPKTDTVNSYDYTRNYHRHNGSISSSFNINSMLLEISAAIVSASVARNEFFPGPLHDRRRATAFLPGIDFSLDGSNSKSITYTTDILLPSVEQWRDQLDTRNPTHLRVGNPDLRREYLHQVVLEYNIFTPGKPYSIRMHLDANVIGNTIADKTVYFTEQTVLPGYNYTVEPQTTLTTYENMGSTVNLDGTMNYSRSVKAIGCRLTAGARFGYNSTPSFVGEQKNRTTIYSPGLTLAVATNFSRKFNLSVTNSDSYIHSINTLGQTDRMMRFGVSARLNSRFLKSCFLSVQYNLSYYKNLSDRIPDRSTQTLNAVAGMQFAKQNLEVSLSAHDILNNNTRFQSSVQDNYIMNRWITSFGRFYTLNVAWKLFRSKSGLMQPKGILMHNGSIETAE